MRPDGHVARWLKTAKRGCCPCGRKLPEGNTRLCRRQRCRREYLRLYALDRTYSTLREVTRAQVLPGRPGMLRLTLSCGHVQEQPRSKAGRSTRRHCRECPGLSNP